MTTPPTTILVICTDEGDCITVTETIAGYSYSRESAIVHSNFMTSMHDNIIIIMWLAIMQNMFT